MFTDVRINIVNKDNLKAVASVTVAGLVHLTGIRVVEGSKGLFITMPARKTPRGDYQDIFFPSSRQGRDALTDAVMVAYHKMVEPGEAMG